MAQKKHVTQIQAQAGTVDSGAAPLCRALKNSYKLWHCLRRSRLIFILWHWLVTRWCVVRFFRLHMLVNFSELLLTPEAALLSVRAVKRTWCVRTLCPSTVFANKYFPKWLCKGSGLRFQVYSLMEIKNSFKLEPVVEQEEVIIISETFLCLWAKWLCETDCVSSCLALNWR